jgi:hypothetical protein
VTTPLPPNQPYAPFLEIDGPNILSSCASKLYLTLISTHGTGVTERGEERERGGERERGRSERRCEREFYIHFSLDS